MGSEWVETHITPDESRLGYFSTSASDLARSRRYWMRVWELAELIYNLSEIENFSTRIDAIRAAETEGVEAGIAELLAGRYFKSQGYPFRFVKGSGKKQDDYDIEFLRADGVLGRCEAKCKLESTALSANTIRNTLVAAKSQLPKGYTGVVLIRVPSIWLTDDSLNIHRLVHDRNNPALVERIQTVGQHVEAFFAKEKTTRLSSVVVFVCEPVYREDGKVIHLNLANEIVNPHHPNPILTTRIERIPADYDENWSPLLRELDICDAYYR